ncbi:hypothetical protein [Cryobacterium zhongshanensis]|uniref:Uncharacterized protein n=1 Tax=Cryobacterium zhongshanensis TaxID=2928153 RepID=A0AA41QVW0_9MICO|nr:hypothetical protein [Cryobacterium zhongshanensis]MCI4658885.1 hypothetical protein [Cryobacterium zhongshanensis]
MKEPLTVQAPRPVRASWKVLVIAFVLLVLSGCAAAPASVPVATPIPAPTPTVLSDTERQTLAEKAQTTLRAELVATYPGVTVPTVTRERFIRLNETAPVLSACMTAEGFPSYATLYNAVAGYVPPGQEQANAVANYICNTRFPLDPKDSVPLNDSQLTYLYLYQTTVLIPCLAFAHVTVDPPPTLQDFIDSNHVEGGSAAVWAPVLKGTAGALGDGISKQCPIMPEHLKD